MGASTFIQRARGKTAEEAFGNARDKAFYDNGHSGYTGTIAEKDCFVEIAVPAGLDPCKFASDLLDDGDPRIDDKWGPAGCVKASNEEWIFFGWASL